MKKDDGYYSNIWQKEGDRNDRLSKDAELICCHRIGVQGVIDVDEYLFLRQTSTQNELWCISKIEPSNDEYIDEDKLRSSYQAVLLLTEPSTHEKQAAAVRLFDELLRARIGYHAPLQLLQSGLVTKESYNIIITEIDTEIAWNRKMAAEQNNSEIIKTAQHLGLNPEPPLLNQKIWSARCPGTNHKLFINAEQNEFGCGYCCLKGNHEKLTEFVKSRRG